MILYDFHGMDENAQTEAVFKEGVYVDSRDEEGLKVQLYRLDFYVEMYYPLK
jgi:hypothetical protein